MSEEIMDLSLLVDLHKGGARQGPGSDAQTKLALDLSGLQEKQGPLKIADIGCGTGASTLVLARSSPSGEKPTQVTPMS